MSSTAAKMTTFESITSEEYAKRYEPVNGFILADKLLTPPKSQGGILLAPGTIDASNKWKGAAVVLKKPRTRCESAWDQYMVDILEAGDVVGFGAATPVLAPAPAHLQFVNPEGQKDRTITLHATDIMGFYFETEEEREAWLKREESAARAYEKRKGYAGY